MWDNTSADIPDYIRECMMEEDRKFLALVDALPVAVDGNAIPMDWPVYLVPPPGVKFNTVATLMLDAARRNPRIKGFIFNGHIVCILEGDTEILLYERYTDDWDPETPGTFNTRE